MRFFVLPDSPGLTAIRAAGTILMCTKHNKLLGDGSFNRRLDL
jgi:hypothetical protein